MIHPYLCFIDNASQLDAIGRDNGYIDFAIPQISKVD